MKKNQLTAREIRMDLAVRSLAALALGLLLLLGFPGAKDAQALLGAETIERVREIFPFAETHERFHGLRAFYTLDFLFLLAVGFLIRGTLVSRDYVVCRWRKLYPGEPGLGPWKRWGMAAAGLYMLSDAAENAAALGILAKVFSDDTGALALGPWLQAAFAAKCLLLGIGLSCCGRAWHSKHKVSWAFYGAGAAWVMGIVWPTAQLVGLGLSALAFGWQAYLWGAPRFVLRLVYFLRVPLVGILLSALLAPLALAPMRQFIGAALYFEADRAGYAGLFGYSLVAFLMALSLSAQAGIILERGAERFDTPSLGFQSWPWLRAWFQYAAMAAASLPALSAVAISYPAGSRRFWVGLVVVGLGCACAMSLAVSADLLRARLSYGDVNQRYVILPRGLQRRFEAEVHKAVETPPPFVVSYAGGMVQRVIRRLRRVLGIGYFDAKGRLYPDHAFALLFFGLTAAVFVVLIYLGIYLDKAPVPTLTSITFLLLFLTMGFAALAFYLDRYRIPLLLGVVGLRAFLGLFSFDTDHSFRIEKPAGQAYKKPSDILSLHERPILIAASGGGIQASAWLTRLTFGLALEPELELRKRVALFSTVSGGSVGAFYLGNYWNDFLSVASEQSRQSSLGNVSWAFAGPDLFRPITVLLGQSLFPKLLTLDRGYALESTLRKRAIAGTDAQNTIEHWAARAGQDFPAFLMNATVTETGGPVAFATTQMPSREFVDTHPNPLTEGHVVQSFAEFRREKCKAALGANVHMATAARLSASFPYISPAARAEGDFQLCNYHFVDGGYYDNYGIVSLLQWLDDALESTPPERLPKRIGILVVRGSNFPATAPRKRWDFADQTSAPVESFLAMRGYAQWQGASAALRLFLEKWCLKRPQLYIEVQRLEYPDLRKRDPKCAEEPLTWKLTPTEQECIDRAYADIRQSAAYERVLRW